MCSQCISNKPYPYFHYLSLHLRKNVLTLVVRLQGVPGSPKRSQFFFFFEIFKILTEFVDLFKLSMQLLNLYIHHNYTSTGRTTLTLSHSIVYANYPDLL